MISPKDGADVFHGGLGRVALLYLSDDGDQVVNAQYFFLCGAKRYEYNIISAMRTETAPLFINSDYRKIKIPYSNYFIDWIFFAE